MLELHGWGDLQTELHRLSRRGEWDTMGTLIDDDMLDAFAVVAPLPELAGALRQRCDGVIDRVLPSLPAGTPEPVIARISRSFAEERRVDTIRGKTEARAQAAIGVVSNPEVL